MEYRIFPPIGLGRIGNSPDFFIGPEVSGSLGREATAAGETEVRNFKDASFRVKRQAVRFRLYQRATSADPFVPVTLSPGSTVRWTVHVANRKDAVIRPSGPPPTVPVTGLRPRDDAARANRAIDSGTQSVEGTNATGVSLSGMHVGNSVELGSMHTDGDGRLIFVPASGVSKSTPVSPIGGSFYNNPNWHDDVCDGPVSASVIDASGNATNAIGAWVVTAPPDFARGVDTIVTLYDIIQQLAVDRSWIAPQRRHPSPTMSIPCSPGPGRCVGLTAVPLAASLRRTRIGTKSVRTMQDFRTAALPTRLFARNKPNSSTTWKTSASSPTTK